MKLIPISAGDFKCDGGALFSVIPKVLWSKSMSADDSNFVQLILRCLLVDLGKQKILIETGVGNHYSEKYSKNNGLEGGHILEKSLKDAGYLADEISDVFFTHLHWDHCNGAVNKTNKGLELAFPNANYWCSKTQWEHSKISNVRERAAYHPEILEFLFNSGRLNLVENEGELFPNITVRFYDGHTPGMMIPFINYKGKTIVYMSDLIPTAANIPLVWLAAYDLYPVTSLEEKEDFLKDAVERDFVLFFEHDFYTECATVQFEEKGFRVNQKCNLTDF